MTSADDRMNQELLETHQGSIYREGQVESWCALHAVNGVLQAPRFCLPDFVEKASELEKKQDVVHHSSEGDFSLETITAVLADANSPIQPYHRDEVEVMLRSQECPLHHLCQGLFIHSPTRDHWYSTKFLFDAWYIV